MINDKSFNRYLSFLLIISFLLLSLAIVPICTVSVVNSSTSPIENTTDAGASLSLIANFVMDFQEAESTAFRYIFLQSSRPKLLNTFVSLLFLLVSSGLLILICSYFSFYKNTSKISSVKIVEYLHNKDGMI